MNITKTAAGFAIKFPFALKDNFRATFPSAKWDSHAKQWSVGPRSLARLEAWTAGMSEAAVAVAAREELAFNEQELARLKDEAARFLKQAGDAEESAQKAKAVKELMLAASQELAAAQAANEEAQQAAKNEQAEVVEILEGILDMDAIRSALKVMAANHTPMVRARKEAFLEAQQEVVNQSWALREAGWECAAIKKMVGANVNRPDRDAMSNIRESDWFNITAV